MSDTTTIAPHAGLRRLATNFTALLTGEAIARALGFVVSIYLARRIGVSNFGIIETGLAALIYFQLFVDGGLDFVATREVVRNPEARARYAGNLIVLRLILACSGLAIVLFLNSVVERPAILEQVLMRYAPAMLPAALSLGWAFQASERMRAVAAGSVITHVTYAVGVFLLVRGADDTLRVPLLFLAGLTAGTLAVWIWYVRRYGMVRPQVDWPFWVSTVRQAFPIACTRLLRGVSFNFDILFLGLFFSERLVGFYGVAYRFIMIPLIAQTMFLTSAFPVIARRVGEEREAAIRQGALLLAVSCSAAAVALMLLAAPLVALVFGRAFAEGAEPLRVLAWSVPFTAVAGIYRQALIANHRQHLDLGVVATGAAVNIALNLALIPPYRMIGAALANVAAEAVVMIAAMTAHRLTRHMAH